MGVILDTSVLIAAERGTFAMSHFLHQRIDESIAVAAITISELLQGSLRTTRGTSSASLGCGSWSWRRTDDTGVPGMTAIAQDHLTLGA